MLLSEFTRLPPAMRATAFDGLSALIDTVADGAIASHRFLCYQWFAASLAAYGGRARTLVVESDGDPLIALPFTVIPYPHGLTLPLLYLIHVLMGTAAGGTLVKKSFTKVGQLRIDDPTGVGFTVLD